MAWTGLALTVAGRNVLNSAQLSQRMNIKSIVIGDGVAPANFSTLTALVHQLYEITDLKVDAGDGKCTLTADIPQMDYDYYFRELGVIVLTDDGEKLYVYDNCGDSAQYIVSTTGAETTRKRIRLSLNIADVAEITAAEPAVLYVGYDEHQDAVKRLEDRIKNNNDNITEHTSDMDKHTDSAERDKWNNGSHNYGTCATAAATAAKTVSCPGFTLADGAEITVKFKVTNTAAAPTLNVNKTGAKAIQYRGAAITAGYLAANRTYTFRYNGAQWDFVGDINTDTKYTHPGTAGNKHIPAGGAEGQILRWSADGTAAWGDDSDTTYGNMKGAAASASGAAGLVPAPAAGDQNKILKGSGRWELIENLTAAFTQAKERINLVSGEALKVSMGKIQKFLADLKTVAFTGKYSDLSGTPEALKNPNALTFSGGVTGSYDGSAKKTVAIPEAAGEKPKAHGTAAAGTSDKYAREDHVHPIQTTVSGNAGTATKLKTARMINGVSFDGSKDIAFNMESLTHLYGGVSTSAALNGYYKILSIPLSAANDSSHAVIKVFAANEYNESMYPMNLNVVASKGAEKNIFEIYTDARSAFADSLYVKTPSGTGGGEFSLWWKRSKSYTVLAVAVLGCYKKTGLTDAARWTYDLPNTPAETIEETGYDVTAVSGTADNLILRNIPAATADKLTSARRIDGVTFDGSENIVHYARCSTAADDAAKTVSCPGFVLAAGAEITVLFDVANTAAAPTLNVSKTGAKAIQYRGAAIKAEALGRLRTYRFLYTGSTYQLIGDLDTNSEDYLPLAGGEVTGPIESTVTSTTWLNANKGKAILNSKAAKGIFTMLAKLNSAAGVFIHGVYKNAYTFYWTDDETIAAGTNAYTKSATILDEEGNHIFPGTAYFTKTTDASGTADNLPAIIVGGMNDKAHLELDANEIMAKANGTTPARLVLNADGGQVLIGKGGLKSPDGIEGNLQGNADTASQVKITRYTASADVDVDTLLTPGVYLIDNAGSAGGTRNGLPGGCVNGWLFVIPTASASAAKQIFLRLGTVNSNDFMTFTRYITSTTVGNWKKYVVTAEEGAQGSAVQPVYVNSAGIILPCTYTLGKSVPGDAAFTDTTYGNMKGATASAAGAAGLAPAPAKGKQTSYLRGDGTWAEPPDTTYKNFVKSGADAAAGLVPSPGTAAGTKRYLREDGTWAVPPDTNTTYTPASTAPKMAGNAAAGSSARYAREDHVHPTDTSRAAASHTHSYLPLAGGIVKGHVNVDRDNTYIFGGEATNLLNIYTRNVENITGAALYVKSANGTVTLAAPQGVTVSKYNSSLRAPISASAFNNDSSRRVKKNVKHITDEEADKILDINVVTFDYIDKVGGAKDQRGCIAEEVINIIPSVVSIPEGYDETKEFRDDEPVIVPSIDYSKFVPYLIRMVQKQNDRINDLEKEVKLLKSI